MPLLVGKVAFGRRSNKYIPLLRRELNARGVLLMKDSVGVGVRSLLAKLKDDEHPVLNKKNSDELNDEERRELKYFLLKYLTAED